MTGTCATIDISTPADAGFALAHCPICDLYLRPDEGCLHMQPVDDVPGDHVDGDRFAGPLPFNHDGEVV